MKEEALKRIDEAIEAFTKIVNHRRAQNSPKSDVYNYELLRGIFESVKDGITNNKSVVAYDWVLHPGLIRAFHMVPIMLMHYTWILSGSLKAHTDCINIGNELGLGIDICGAHRIPIGLYNKGWIPPLAAHITYSAGCDNLAGSYKIEQEYQRTPFFYIDLPLPANHEDAFEYIMGELNDLVKFLGDVSKRKMDMDVLRNNIKLTAEMHELMFEIKELLKAKPCPMESRRNSQSYWLSIVYCGTEEIIKYFNILRDELKDRVNKGIGAIPNEKYRLMSIPPPPVMRSRLLEWLEKEHGAIVAMDLHWCWRRYKIDPDDPIETIGRRMLNFPIFRHVYTPIMSEDGWVSDVVKAAEEHQIDGLIIWGNPACRPTGGSHKLIKDNLKKKLGIPTVVVDNDPIDLTYTTEDKLRETFEEFLEVIEANR